MIINNIDYDYLQSHLNPRPYKPNEIVRIINMKQAKLYICNNVYPIDIYSGLDKKGNTILVMVFLKEQTQEVYELWKNWMLEEDTL